MTVTEADIQAFAEFVRQRTSRGEAELTIAELAAQWQATREREEVNSAIRESLNDIAAGRTEPFAQSQDSFRQGRNLPPRT
jgi:hypothetical protein